MMIGIFLGIGFPIQTVLAQDNDVLPDMLERCDALGIDLEKCSEETILERSGGQIPRGPSESEPLSMNWIAIVAIATLLGGAGVFFFARSTRKKVKRA